MHALRSRNVNAPLPGTGIRPFGGTENIYLYESSGLSKQNQLITNFRGRLKNVNFFGFYALVGKTSAIFGPIIFGLASWLSGGNQRIAIVAIGLFFLAGLLLVSRVRAGGPTAVAVER